MKSTQLLSVVLSLIMFTGVTAGNTAFAESDDVDDLLEEFCEMSIVEQDEILSEYGLDGYAKDFAEICAMDDGEIRDESLEALIDEIKLEVFDETDDDSDDIIEDFEDCVEAGYPVMEIFPEQCMTGDGTVFTNTDDDDDDVDGDIYEREDDYNDDYTNDGKRHSVEDRLAHFCDMSEEETLEFFEHHPRLEQFAERLANYCDLPDYTRDSKIKDFIRQNITDEDRKQVRDNIKDHMKEKYEDRDVDHDFREKLASWCEMTDEKKSTTATEYGKTKEMVAKADRYCTLDKSDRADFIAEHRDEFRAHMKDRMMDKAHDKPHMDYDRLCALDESKRAAEIDDSEKLERLDNWCDMSTGEREEYKKEHHGEMKEKGHDKVMDKTHDDKHEKKMKLSDKSDRIKAMIMDKHDISDERAEEIKMKYIEKHGDLTDKKKSELKMKFKNHMASMKVSMSEDRRSDIHDRLAEMKAYKAELRESSDMTDEEKQELRAEFIEKAKDMQLAWINPRVQMTAGVVAGDVECREGFSLVMKASNGVAMCLKADTALKMIDRGLVVPAN